jgi:hypothetical protein
MKKTSLTITMTAFLCLGFFAGCTDILSGPPAGIPEGGPAGTGQALIRLGPRAEGARTFMPAGADYGALSYTYTFRTAGKNSVSGEITQEEEIVVLAVGKWTLTVQGAADNGRVPSLEGIVQDIEITQRNTSPVNVPLKVKTGGGTGGSLRYSVSFPDTVIRGSLTVYRWEDDKKEGTPADLLDGASSESGRITAEDTLSLPAGYYLIALDLYQEDGFFSRTDVAHIYAGMTTETGEYSLTAGDFTPAEVEEGTSLADVLSAISGLKAWENKTCLLSAGDELMPAASAANSDGPITVTIDGGGRVVTLEGKGGFLVTVGENVTLVLKNITLKV